MSASRLEDVWVDREPAGAADAHPCALMGELSSRMVGIAAALARAQRGLLAADPIGDELRRIDEGFATPIALARKLGVAVHASHDCERSPRGLRG